MKTEKFVDFVKNVRFAHKFSIFECVLMMLIILNHVKIHLFNQFAKKFIFQLYIILKILKSRLQELEREQQLIGMKNDLLFFYFFIFLDS